MGTKRPPVHIPEALLTVPYNGFVGSRREQQAELKEAFDLFDADKSGQIDVRARSRSLRTITFRGVLE